MVVETVAWLAQRAIRDTSFSEEDAHRGYSSSLYSLLVPPQAPLTAHTQVVDAAGATYEVEGDPAVRYRGFTREPLFLAASLRRLSDRQEV